jgi:hypothetical protein
MPIVNPLQSGGGIVFATPADLITKALQDIGVVGFGMPATAAEIESGLQTLNVMLDMWGVLRENISVRIQDDLTFVIGQSVYGIGIGSNDFDTLRPIKIESAYYTDSSGTDIPIDLMGTEAQYSDIALKGISGTPTSLYYKPTYPFGTLYFNFAPTVAWTLHILSWKPFAKITDAGDLTQMSYPDGYEAAMVFNLAKLLCPPNKKQCPAEIAEAAAMSLQAIQAAYGEVPTVKFDCPGLGGGRRASFFDMNSGR